MNIGYILLDHPISNCPNCEIIHVHMKGKGAGFGKYVSAHVLSFRQLH